MTETRSRSGHEAQGRALWGWSPPDLPADTAVKRRIDRFMPRSGIPAVLYCAAVAGLLGLAAHLPGRAALATDGAAALAAGAWCALNFSRCRHAPSAISTAGSLSLSLAALPAAP